MTLNALALPKQIEEIRRLGNLRAPNEAGGLILPDGQVWELPNRADQYGQDPTQNFHLSTEDLRALVRKWCDENPGEEEIAPIIWHTHPNGLVGPSNVDLEQRLDNLKYLVVTIPTGEAVRF